MDKFTKEEAISFCKKCYKNDKGQCVYHNKNEQGDEILYNSIGCQHAKLTAANYYCAVCGEAPKKWDTEKQTWVTMPSTAITTSENVKDKSPPTNSNKNNNVKDFQLPDNSVNCSEYHNNMMGCVKHSECNYCQMPSKGAKDMKCVSNNMKDKLTIANVIDTYSCVDKAQFNLNNRNQVDQVGVNSTNYNSYTALDGSNNYNGYNSETEYASYNNTEEDIEASINNAMNSSNNKQQEVDEVDEEVVMANEEKRGRNEAKKTNNNDKSQFFFLGENPSVAESVKYHFDKGYFFDTYTDHGVEFNEQNSDTVLPEYNEDVFEKNENIETFGNMNEEPEYVEEQTETKAELEADNTVINKNTITPQQNIKNVVSLQNMLRDMENTSQLLNYGLIAIVIIMIIIFTFLVLKRK